MDIREILFAYSEWLDSEQHLVRGEEETGDKRSHDDLVEQFLEEEE